MVLTDHSCKLAYCSARQGTVSYSGTWAEEPFASRVRFRQNLNICQNS